MSALADPSRRDFLKTGAAVGGGLILGVALPDSLLRPASAQPAASMPNAWVRIGRDDSITIISARSEMGQGVYTAMPTLVAEELEVDLGKIKVEIAPSAESYINTLLGGQITGGSTSVVEGYDKLRIAGAQARTMLVSAAAQKWGVDASACRAQDGAVAGPAGQKATYGELAEAAAKLAVPTDVKLKEHKDSRYVGKAVNRLDTPGKVNGTAEFGIDVRLPGMLYASLAQCPVIGGKVVSFDAAKAKAMPGVKHVVQITDGVAVVADSWWRAKTARDALAITWDEGAGKSLNSAGISAALKAAAAKPGAAFKKQGDIEAGLAGAAKKLQAEYELPFLAHATMEPMNFTADVRPGSCHVYGPTQFQQLASGVAAQASGLKPEQVVVHTTFLGGGFGRRIDVDFIGQAVEISKAVGAPVKLLWTREDDMTHDFYRPTSYHQMSGGLDAAGRPVALKFHLTSPSVTSRLFPPVVKEGVDPFMTEAAVVPYDIPNQLADVVIHDTGVRVGYWRSVSHALNAFAYESFIDEMAAAAGKDPYQFRLALLEKQPRLKGVLQLAAEKSGWGTPAPAGRFRGIALMEGYGTAMSQVAEVSVAGPRVRVHRVVVAADLGKMVNPNIVRQQLESSIIFGLGAVLYGEITLKDGRVQQSNFHDYQVVRMPESPKIEMHIVESGEKPAGIGEPGTALVGPAVANAVFAATGKRLRKLPLRLV
ncbi:MAG: aldehyde oxidase [Acidobacteria bacterium]|nr:MAG: aldehyde oxidase [Acidobacteriota bacterium]